MTAILNEQILTSPLGHKVYRTAFRDTPEAPARVHWLYARRKLITATDWASILGFTDKPSAYAVWQSKVGEPGEECPTCAGTKFVRAREQDEDGGELREEQCDACNGLGRIFPDLAAENEAVLWGSLLEDEIAKEAARRLGRTFIDHGRHTLHWTREVIPGVPIGCSLDREISPLMPYVGEPCMDSGCRHSHSSAGHHLPLIYSPPDPRGPGIYEGKTSGLFSHGAEWEQTEEDEVGAPLRAQVQVQASMAVLGWQYGVIGGLLGGFHFKLHLREIERDSGFEDFLRWATPKLQDFWKRVEQKDPPPIDGSESTYEALKRQFPKDSGFEITLPIESQVWHEELTGAKAREKAAKSDVENYRNKFLAAMGEATIGRLPDGSGYSLARTKDPKPTCCPKCSAEVSRRKASRPLRWMAEE